MVAFANVPGRLDDAKPEHPGLGKESVIRRTVLMFVGTTLLAAAGGLWFVPSGAQDPAMELIKLLASVVIGLIGMVFFSMIDNKDNEPEIRLDPASRQMRVLEFAENGDVVSEKQYDLDSLMEISLYDNSLTARDFTGKQVIAVPVNSAATRRALKAALGLAA